MLYSARILVHLAAAVADGAFFAVLFAGSVAGCAGMPCHTELAGRSTPNADRDQFFLLHMKYLQSIVCRVLAQECALCNDGFDDIKNAGLPGGLILKRHNIIGDKRTFERT